MAETIVVIAIVGVVLLLAARSLYRTLTGKNDGCGCGKGACSASGHCQSPQAATKTREESHGD
ncbi:MAG: hypothetical protein A3K19_06550 [Lentisphaerae bacterium RIFOXYB12_FULL_65_16]|nr:MAG: hypothetical protein A3K18_02090 [Lentisphaerae bacterium RIFOXYA12_64_32]OGV93099.1 MAG: hypothetical protein A3K19_06550 [Lentisphaerae bacterium RIFOXYB12_FULL_65_16]